MVVPPKLRHHGAVVAHPARRSPVQRLGIKAFGEGSFAREVVTSNEGVRLRDL